MGRKKRNRSTAAASPEKRPSWLRRHAFWIGIAAFAVAAITAAHYLPGGGTGQTPTATVPTTPAPEPIPPTAQKAFTLDKLLAMPVEQLADVDIAEMNLLCAKGLPGAEDLDVAQAMATLDQWATRVKYETERHLYRVTDPRYAEHYRHSEAYLRAEMLVQVLCEDLGVKYDLSAKDTFAYNDSRVAFIHGMIPTKGQTIAETPGGTCASMPVLYVAVGRRLGYPLKLVTTRGHVFVRWDGKDHLNPAWRERINMEGTHGFSSYPDDYYKTWPAKVTEAEIKINGYFVSLTPSEELAEFLASRGHCGTDNGQLAFAARCFENAYRYDTQRRCYREWFLDAARKSGYRPVTPALASLLQQRMRPGSDPEFIIGQQQAAARREWLRSQGAGTGAPALPNGMPVGGLQPPQPGIPQPYQPPTPGQPPGQ
ncbi:MAG: hypothetical protein JXL80_12970 [Planctomycetes bacterium]|nr:hypothetical protein [Planctomycetota bacterium]